MAETGKVIIAEKGEIPPSKRRQLEEAGYIVVVVKDVEKVKMLEPETTQSDDEGFQLHA